MSRLLLFCQGALSESTAALPGRARAARLSRVETARHSPHRRGNHHDGPNAEPHIRTRCACGRGCAQTRYCSPRSITWAGRDPTAPTATQPVVRVHANANSHKQASQTASALCGLRRSRSARARVSSVVSTLARGLLAFPLFLPHAPHLSIYTPQLSSASLASAFTSSSSSSSKISSSG